MHLFALAAALSAPASAQETVDVGVIHPSDINVVQNLLYPKKDKKEFGLHVGAMPFDAYTITPMASLTGAMHTSESWGFELALGGGYGLKNQAYRELEGPAYAISPDAYRYLGSALIDAQWSPIYAKMNWQGNRVFHNDFYGLAGAGLTVEQAILPDNALAFAPTVGLGLGTRIFLSKSAALRVQIRDDVLAESRVKTGDLFIKQNVGVSVGLVKLKE